MEVITMCEEVAHLGDVAWDAAEVIAQYPAAGIVSVNGPNDGGHIIYPVDFPTVVFRYAITIAIAIARARAIARVRAIAIVRAIARAMAIAIARAIARAMAIAIAIARADG